MCIGAITLTLFIIEKIKKYSLKATIIKATTSLFFILVSSVSLYTKGEHILAVFVTIGLFFGLLGDIFLDFKYVYKEKHEVPFTYAGFIAFAIGHAFYISGMFLEYYHGENVLFIIIPLVVGILMSLINWFLEKPMKLVYGRYKPISFIYGMFLFSLTGVALSLSILHHFESTTLIMMIAGGVLFTISDLILSGTYFGVGKERPVDIASNAVTYYMAQFIIAFAMFFI